MAFDKPIKDGGLGLKAFILEADNKEPLVYHLSGRKLAVALEGDGNAVEDVLSHSV